MKNSDRTYFVISSTEGCATNLQENNGYRKDYEAQGYTQAAEAAKADVILINTCAYSQQMEDRSTDMISTYKNKYPNSNVVVAGCLPKINPKLMKTTFSELKTKSFPEMLQFSESNQFDKSDFESLSDQHQLIVKLRPYYYKIENFFKTQFHPLHNIFKTVVVNEDFHLITASTGCLGKCTFCAIKRAKGSLKSRPKETIVSEIEHGLKAGKKLFWLLGDDIGCWGLDIQSNISELLKSMINIGQPYELVLNYFDPHYFKNNTNELVTYLSNRKVIGLNIPIQSGSQKILSKMERHYDLNFVFQTLKTIKTMNPAVAIKTNIIVGFPGETWSDFLLSLKSVFKFDAILALKFTPRPLTPAASMPNQVSEFKKNIRMLIMNLTIFIRHFTVASRSVIKI